MKIISLERIEKKLSNSALTIRITTQVDQDTIIQIFKTKNVPVERPSTIEINEELMFGVDEETCHDNFHLTFEAIDESMSNFEESIILATGTLMKNTSREELVDIEMIDSDGEQVATLEIAIAGDGPYFK